MFETNEQFAIKTFKNKHMVINIDTHLIHVSCVCSQILCTIQFSIRPFHLDNLSLCRWAQP